ncbi:MAG: hypothetical protein KDD64_04790 [Bdellovibrionales bacterium]|nr:hypothetical protein [Bdellovibrionales bacterium]
MDPIWDDVEVRELLSVLLSFSGEREARAFLRDLLTESELREFARRWQTARLLDAGVSYAEIEATTGLSSTTIARISKWLKEGAGGYREILDRRRSAR